MLQYTSSIFLYFEPTKGVFLVIESNYRQTVLQIPSNVDPIAIFERFRTRSAFDSSIQSPASINHIGLMPRTCKLSKRYAHYVTEILRTDCHKLQPTGRILSMKRSEPNDHHAWGKVYALPCKGGLRTSHNAWHQVIVTLELRMFGNRPTLCVEWQRNDVGVDDTFIVDMLLGQHVS
ncbi:MAG: hypothetical protein ABIR91_00035 [Candidatus Saccharimonadales bacterium]